MTLDVTSRQVDAYSTWEHFGERRNEGRRDPAGTGGEPFIQFDWTHVGAASDASANLIYLVRSTETMLLKAVHVMLRARPSAQDRLFEMKMAFSPFANRLGSEWRDGLFAQLDDLLGEDWVEGDALPDLRAFQTFLRLIVKLDRPRRPGIGVSDEGWILAGWHTPRTRLTIRCLPGDELQWTLSVPSGEGRESQCGSIKLNQIREALAPWGLERLLDAGTESGG